MKFVKQYTVELIIAAVALIGVGIFLYMRSTNVAAAEEALESHVKVAGMTDIARSGKSEAELKARQAWLDQIRKEARQVRQKALQRNKAGYTVLPVAPAPGVADDRVAPMFPWPKDPKFGREARAYEALRTAFMALDDGLMATVPPNDLTVQEEAQRRLNLYKIQREQLLQKYQNRQDNNGGPIPMGEEEEPGFLNRRLGPLGDRFTRPTDIPEAERKNLPELLRLDENQIAQKATDEARRMFTVQAARKGRIYVDPNFFEANPQQGQTRQEQTGETQGLYQAGPYQPLPYNLVPADQKPQALFQEHVRLWVMRDIVQAIQKTNDSAVRNQVMDAPIKRLIWIQTDGRFFTGKLGNGQGESRMWDDEEGEGPGYRYRPQIAGGTVQQEKPTADTLTKDVSTEDVDIVRYSIYMILEPQKLNEFLLNLSKINYHTALAIEYEEVVNPVASNYYYGASPVIRVRIDGQLRLLSDFTRGQPANAEPAGPARAFRGGSQPAAEIKWNPQFPPLAPLQVLQVPEYQYALRQVDKQRLPEQPAPAGPIRR